MDPINLTEEGLSNLIKCPYCGKDAIFTYETDNAKKYNDFTKFIFSNDFINEVFKTLTCAHCSNTIFVHSVRHLLDKFTWVYIYPNKATIDISKEISETFPIFIQIFTQALQAKVENLNHLVGPGLRKAVEFLVTDYLIKIQNENNIEKISLEKKIDKLDKSIYASACADLIRIFGNDEIHYINDNNVNIEEAIEYTYLLCESMSARIATIKANEKLMKIRPKQVNV